MFWSWQQLKQNCLKNTLKSYKIKNSFGWCYINLQLFSLNQVVPNKCSSCFNLAILSDYKKFPLHQRKASKCLLSVLAKVFFLHYWQVLLRFQNHAIVTFHCPCPNFFVIDRKVNWRTVCREEERKDDGQEEATDRHKEHEIGFQTTTGGSIPKSVCARNCCLKNLFRDSNILRDKGKAVFSFTPCMVLDDL